MHTPSSDVRLAFRIGRLGARRDVWFLSLDLATSAGLVQSGCRNEVLHNGAVAVELERGVGTLRCGFGDDCLEQGVLDVDRRC